MSQNSPSSVRSASVAADPDVSMYGALARHEIKRYARHPLFLLGVVLCAVIAAMGPDKTSSSLMDVIAPGAAIGVFGLLVMASLVRGSDKAAAAGSVVAGERTRTLALATAAVVPLVAGLLFLVWAVWAFHAHPPVASAAPFGGVGNGWAYAILIDLGVISCVGGPVLGLVVGRWLHFRGAAVVTAVCLVLVTVVFQGIVAPLRTVRVFLPWTQFTGPIGVKGDANRWLILTGSPQWYGVYLIALIAIGVLVAVLHDSEQPRGQLLRVLAVVAVVALVLGVLAMTMGVGHTMINPLPSGSA